jgi:hypothetical protein
MWQFFVRSAFVYTTLRREVRTAVLRDVPAADDQKRSEVEIRSSPSTLNGSKVCSGYAVRMASDLSPEIAA